MSTYVRYALVDGNGKAARHDCSCPLVCDTVEGLVSLAGHWSDLEDDGFLLALAPGGRYAGYRIVREEVAVFDLNKCEMATLDRLRPDGRSGGTD